MSSTVLGRNAVTVNKKYTEYFLPTVLTAMATNIAMIVDSIIAGNLLGQNSLAAINLMSPISQLYFSITILFGLGASSIISFAKGRRDEKQANRVFTSTFIVLIALSVIFIAIQLPLADSISSLLTKDAELKSLLYQYYVPFIIGTPIYLLLMCSIHFVRADARPAFASNIVIVANAVNLGLDFLFMGAFKMGIAGSSIATVTGYAVGFVMMSTHFIIKKSTLHFDFSILRNPVQFFKFLGKMVTIGLSGALGTMLITVKMLFLNTIIQSIGGSAGMVSYSVCSSSQIFMSMFITGATPILTSQKSAVFSLISNLIVFGMFIILSSPLKIKTKLVVESITKPTIIMILIFLYLGGSMATFGTYYIIPSSDYRTITLKILTLIVSIVFSFSIPILLYNQIKKSRYMHENDIYERQLNAQINYYKSITTSGYELRKIRHDYNDLSIGLKSLINSRKYDEVLPLLQKYDSEIISSFQILYNTGNDLTDAILSDKQKNADENIKITFEGSLANVPADNLEICVLFNNMIDIAFENVKEFCGNGKQIIALKAETRAGFLFCCISFPIENEIKKAQNNVLYHSFAYKTLENLAEKNGGKIETSLSDDRLAITTGWVINNFS